MAQFDPTTFSPQIIWLVIMFGVFYFALAKFALPRILEVLEERQRNIDESLDRAASLKEDAKNAAEAYEKMLNQSRAEAQLIMRQTREKIAVDAAKRQQALMDRLASDIQAAEQRIGEAKEKALSRIHQVAAEVAGAAVEKLSGEKPEASDVANAINSVMADRT